MKEGRMVPDVLSELKLQEARKRDYIVPASQMSLLEDGETFQVLNEAKGQMELFHTSALAHRQLASALNIPAKYYDFKNPPVFAPERLYVDISQRSIVISEFV